MTSGYREFADPVLDRLAVIRTAQAIGLTLGEIRGIVALSDDGQTPCGHVLELLLSRSKKIDRTIRELRALQRELNRLVDRARDLDPAKCDPITSATSSARLDRAFSRFVLPHALDKATPMAAAPTPRTQDSVM